MQRSIPSRSVCGKCRRPPPIKGPGRDRRWRCASHCRAELEGPARRLDPADAEKPRQLTAGELADKVGSLETRIAALKLVSGASRARICASYWWWLPRSAWALGVAHVEGKGAAGDDITVVERKEQWSANLLAILGNYALPMMYGLLGAAAAAMMNVNQKIRSSRLSPRDRRMSQVQLVLGVITGGCIGLFLTPSGAGTTATPLSGGGVAFSASALSFLAGFGVEGVFKMVQNILVTVFGDQPHTSSAKPSA